MDKKEEWKYFMKNHNRDEKIAILKEVIYPKKKMVKTSSIINLRTAHADRKHLFQTVPVQETRDNKREDDEPEIRVLMSQPHSPKKTMIEFFPKKENQNCELKTTTSKSWFPSTRSAKTIKRPFLHRQEEQKNRLSAQKEENKTVEKPYEKVKAFPGIRDAQSLLRKNSLFLLNFIQTREKKKKGAHLGEYPVVLGNLNQDHPHLDSPYRQERRKNPSELVKYRKFVKK